MAKKKALVQRYDCEQDILAIEKNGCSEVHVRSRDPNFQLVVVVPTKAAGTKTSVVADATSDQYPSNGGVLWPCGNRGYEWRIDVENVRYTKVDKVRAALEKAGKVWKGAWQVMSVTVDENDLL